MLSSQTKGSVEVKPIPVAFVAVIKQMTSCKLAVSEIMRADTQADSMFHMGVEQLSFHTQKIGNDDVIVVMFDLTTNAFSSNSSEVWTYITQSSPMKEMFAFLGRSLKSHQRVKGDDFCWVQAENICQIRPSCVTECSQSSWHVAVTRLREEKEAEYRLLHNNVWPGVVDAIGASHISRFDIFLIEFGENQPHLFYRFQYIGTNLENDLLAQSLSPINQRWWKFTDACQLPLPNTPPDSPWLSMRSL